MRPNITDYYLERGILYHRLGYYPQAKEDFVAFGVMRPDAQMVLKEKILSEKSEHKKKEYIAVLAKMFWLEKSIIFIMKFINYSIYARRKYSRKASKRSIAICKYRLISKGLGWFY